MFRFVGLLILLVISTAGCRQPLINQQQRPLFGNQFNQGPQFAGGTSPANFGGQANVPPQFAELSNQVQDLNSRLSQFNSDNDNLHAQVAALQQRLQNANNYNDQLKQQLSDTLGQLQQSQVQMQQVTQQAQQQVAAAQQSNQASTQFVGATVRANNSLMGQLAKVQLPGVKAWMDGEVIRIEASTDQVFVPGSYQINQTYTTTFQNLAAVIRESFPQQVVGVEAHWDGTPLQPATISHHQLTTTQALAAFDLLVRSGLPHRQVFTMAMGSNRPRYNQGVVAQNGVSPNRRLEIVIYPETFQ